ncbi:hypothetical protein CDL12_05400 [Handroanthus impetiginosus]|uniref:Uncharacterized protein n=1 Tax=Handroanthus impetiginosus TaxID=429701 RepID=A0A2G9HWK1_9LAMI|nr:hypothetical protein CDL12_05400 [Handroanthus impetiginosus]
MISFFLACTRNWIPSDPSRLINSHLMNRKYFCSIKHRCGVMHHILCQNKLRLLIFLTPHCHPHLKILTLWNLWMMLQILH